MSAHTPYNGVHDTPFRRSLLDAFVSGALIERRPIKGDVPKVWEEDAWPTWYWADYEYRIKGVLQCEQ